MKKVLTIFVLFCAIPAVTGKEPVEKQRGTVISQDIGSEDSGAVAAPIGNIVAVVPIQKHWNVVVIQTETQRLTLQEEKRPFVVLPINESIEFYTEKDKYIILDKRGKKHRFILTRMETLGRDAFPSADPALAPGRI